MKKVFVLMVMLFAMTAFVFGQEVEKATSAVHQDVVKGTSAVYSDATKATATVYEDATKATATVYNDLKDATGVVYPDAKGAIGTLYADGKKAIDYLVPKVEAALTALAAGLKTTTAQVWKILVYKQVAFAITSTIYVLIALFLIFWYGWGVNRVLKSVKAKNGYWEVGQGMFTVIGGAISLGLFAFAIIQVPIIINGFVVPEAGALNEAVTLTRQLIGSFK